MKRIINIKTVLISALLLSFASYVNAVDIPTVDDFNKQVPELPNKKESDASSFNKVLDEKVIDGSEVESKGETQKTENT